MRTTRFEHVARQAKHPCIQAHASTQPEHSPRGKGTTWQRRRRLARRLWKAVACAIPMRVTASHARKARRLRMRSASCTACSSTWHIPLMFKAARSFALRRAGELARQCTSQLAPLQRHCRRQDLLEHLSHQELPTPRAENKQANCSRPGHASFKDHALPPPHAPKPHSLHAHTPLQPQLLAPPAPPSLHQRADGTAHGRRKGR